MVMGIKATISDMVAMAKARGGKCLSPVYFNAGTKLSWQCSEGHTWKAVPNSIQQGTWCPRCAGILPGTIEEMRQVAKQRGGRCLSLQYLGRQNKLKWQCEKGHVWEAVPDTVINRSSWCPVCAGTVRKTLRDMQRLAREKGGKCLSKVYINSDTPLLWECARGHRWKTRYDAVAGGHWCLRCAHADKYPSRLELLKRLAIDRGGQCLSKRYLGTRKKILWECKLGHRWKSTPDCVYAGQWCPECGTHIAEAICRVYFEHIFKRRFPKARPKWLVNDAGNQMELDGYCRSLKLAFEHQGLQHYHQTRFFHSKQGFEKRVTDDDKKHALCRRHGVTLIEVPQIGKLTRLAVLGVFIMRECRKRRKDLVFKTCDFDGIDMSKAYVPMAAKGLEKCRAAAKARNGECLAKVYVNVTSKVRWRCDKGHEWLALPNNVIRGAWCPQCSYKSRNDHYKLGIEKMQETARKRGGKCLSEHYENCEVHLTWQCAKGHDWQAIPNNVMRGSWCPVCARQKSRPRGRGGPG